MLLNIMFGTLLIIVLAESCPIEPETETGYYWRTWNGTVPEDAVIAGSDSRGLYYIAKAWLPGRGIYIGQVFSGQITVDIAWSKATTDGIETSTTNEILCSNDLSPIWHGATEISVKDIINGSLYAPVVGGITSQYSMNPVYIGKLATLKGEGYVGSIHIDYFMNYVDEKGFAQYTPSFDLLVVQK